MKTQVVTLAMAAMIAAGMSGSVATVPEVHDWRKYARPQYTSQPLPTVPTGLVNRSREEARRRRQAAALLAKQAPETAQDQEEAEAACSPK